MRDEPKTSRTDARAPGATPGLSSSVGREGRKSPLQPVAGERPQRHGRSCPAPLCHAAGRPRSRLVEIGSLDGRLLVSSSHERNDNGGSR